MALEIRSRKELQVVIIGLAGRLDVLERGLLPHTKQLIENGTLHFGFNLTDLEYIDASGLGQLVAILTVVENVGGSVTLIDPTERLRKLLYITKLDTVFRICAQRKTNVLTEVFVICPARLIFCAFYGKRVESPKTDRVNQQDLGEKRASNEQCPMEQTQDSL